MRRTPASARTSTITSLTVRAPPCAGGSAPGRTWPTFVEIMSAPIREGSGAQYPGGPARNTRRRRAGDRLASRADDRPATPGPRRRRMPVRRGALRGARADARRRAVPLQTLPAHARPRRRLRRVPQRRPRALRDRRVALVRRRRPAARLLRRLRREPVLARRGARDDIRR